MVVNSSKLSDKDRRRHSNQIRIYRQLLQVWERNNTASGTGTNAEPGRESLGDSEDQVLAQGLLQELFQYGEVPPQVLSSLFTDASEGEEDGAATPTDEEVAEFSKLLQTMGLGGAEGSPLLDTDLLRHLGSGQLSPELLAKIDKVFGGGEEEKREHCGRGEEGGEAMDPDACRQM